MKTRTYRLALTIIVVVTCSVTALAANETAQNLLAYSSGKLRDGFTVDERVAEYGADVHSRLAPAFATAGVAYPPRELSYVAFKAERRLEVYARNAETEPWRHVAEYPILGASGTIGPKLKEGDRQVPEGIYRATFLNPNSRFHLSIRLNYPNAFDKAMAAADGRTKLGGDIMIHGGSSSIGCLAVGNQAAEDLFVLAALAAKARIQIIVSPSDFRVAGVSTTSTEPTWVATLYSSIRTALLHYQRK